MAEAGFAHMIAVMEEAGAHRVRIIQGVVPWNRGGTTDKVGQVATTPHLQPYEWVGLASSFDGEQLTTLVLAHDNPALATENAAAVEAFFRDGVPATHPAARWADVFALEAVEARGLLVVASIRPLAGMTSSYRLVDVSIERRDNLLWAAERPS